MQLFTIGFSGKSAAKFFTLLEDAKVQTLVDIRLNNRSQLAGFTKAADLEFFLKRVSGIRYVHLPQLAPSAEILSAYRSKTLSWAEYCANFDALMQERKIDSYLRKELKQIEKPLCLLCSEEKAAQCHRSLVAARIQKIYPKFEIVHL